MVVALKQAAPPPRSIGPYRLLGVLAEGGMSVVYRAERAGAPRRTVAIKTVRALHASHLAGIRREIQALLRLRHPGIVQVLDAGVEDGLPWYAMELLEGRTLGDAIRAAWAHPSYPPLCAAPARLEAALEATPTAPARFEGPVEGTPTTPMVAPAPQTDFVHLSSAQAARPEGGGRPARRPRAGGDDLARVLQVMRELCETLAFLHGEGIIHRDLKPGNVFLRGGVAPVLMDFGIAWRYPAAVGREVLDLPLPWAGTISFMAPEQIRGEIVDARADLYAVGCILYEAVTGRLPFDSATDDVILRHHLHTAPTPPSEIVEGVAPALEDLILRLLEKRPRDRLGHADDVAQALEAIGASRRPGGEPTPARAYVYRPELSGREEAMAELTLHVDRVVGGAGGRVLVRGESGIGKTHLCMALARAAAARNVEVIAASCAPVIPSATAAGSGGAGAARAGAPSPNDAPLHAFRPLLRTIADYCLEGGAELSRELLGHRASLLAVCEPALARLPGLAGYPDPPQLPARAARERLLRSVAETIAAFAKKWPLLLVIDDLQWADELSLDLLTSLSDDYFNQCPALILATCRAEQIRGRLEELAATPGVTSLDLGKLDDGSVAAMLGDMLAMSAPPESFVRFLARRSEGNPFFVAEYVRAAVAEDVLCRSAAGRWRLKKAEGDAVFDQLPLPASVSELCRRRLSDLSQPARELMEMASVIGRDIEWSLLSGAAGMADGVALDAARELVTKHILEEPEPGQLRFLHDKLREAAHDPIPAARRARIHGIVARTIEARSAGAADFPLVYAKLARHFIEAGDDKKALEYLEKAGDLALETCSNREAAALFGELIARGVEIGARPPTEQELLQWARWERRLGEAHSGLGDFGGTIEHAGRALSWSGYPLPGSRSGWIARLLREISVQAAHRIAPDARGAQAIAERAGAVEASIALGGLAKIYFFSDAKKALAAGLWSMNLAERAGGGARLASMYAVLGLTTGLCKLPALARTYFELARGTAEATNDDAGLVFSLHVQGYWLQSQGGPWDAARAISEEAVERARRRGDLNEIGSAEIILGLVELNSGHAHESRRRFQALARGAAERGNGWHVAVGLVCLATALLRLGQLDEAEDRLEEARAALERREDSQMKVTCLGLLAAVRARKGEIDRAVTLADIVSTEAAKAPVMMGLTSAYGGAAEAYLGALARAEAGRPAEIAAARGALRRILPRFFLAASVHPIGLSLYHYIWGRMRWLEGAPAGARRAWERSLDAAMKRELPYDEALARVELARAEPPDSAVRQRHLEIAEALGSEIGARAVLAEIWALRAEASPASH